MQARQPSQRSAPHTGYVDYRFPELLGGNELEHPHPMVRAVRCDHRADDEAVYQALRRATDPLERAWARLGKAHRIAIKFNQDKASQAVVTFAGQRQQLVSDSVIRATLRLLRERTNAELVCADVSFYCMYNG